MALIVTARRDFVAGLSAIKNFIQPLFAPRQMSKLFQISEDDLSELERILPQLAEALEPTLNNRLRVQLRQCQSIASNVRWNYGPPSQVMVIPAEDV